MLIKQNVSDVINAQVVEEFAASMQYLAIALYFDRETLPELSGYFHLQAQEEHGHAMKLLQYLNDAGAVPAIGAIPAVKNEFDSVEECIQLALDQEITVTNQINNIVDVAVKENDHSLAHRTLKRLPRQQGRNSLFRLFYRQRTPGQFTISDLRLTIKVARQN